MGQLLKILVLLGIVALIIHKIRQIGRADNKPVDNEQENKIDNPMVACNVCGTYVPKNEALYDAGKGYCSAEHRDQGKN